MWQDFVVEAVSAVAALVVVAGGILAVAVLFVRFG